MVQHSSGAQSFEKTAIAAQFLARKRAGLAASRTEIKLLGAELEWTERRQDKGAQKWQKFEQLPRLAGDSWRETRCNCGTIEPDWFYAEIVSNA